MAIGAVAFDGYTNYRENKRFIQERTEINSKIVFWQSAIDRFPNYRDAYFKLAVLNYRLKNYDKAKEYLNKALKIDPNFKEGRELERSLK